MADRLLLEGGHINDPLVEHRIVVMVWRALAPHNGRLPADGVLSRTTGVRAPFRVPALSVPCGGEQLDESSFPLWV